MLYGGDDIISLNELSGNDLSISRVSLLHKTISESWLKLYEISIIFSSKESNNELNFTLLINTLNREIRRFWTQGSGVLSLFYFTSDGGILNTWSG